MDNPQRVTVVIPNWNGEKYIGECLGALERQTLGGQRVIVIDNASRDGSREIIKNNHPEVELIESSANEGFARAVNKGIRAADTEFVALLNNDAVADPDWLEKVVAALDSNPGFDSVACKIVFYDDPNTIDSAGDEYSPWGAVSNRGHGLRDGGDYDLPARVFGPCAAAALYRKSLFDEIGLFDENFFAYYEDTDLNLRAAIAGRKCFYAPGARVRHRYSASSSGKTRKLGVEEVYIHLTGVAVKGLPAAASAPLKAAVFHGAIFFFFVLARLRKRNRLPSVPLIKFMSVMFAQRRATAGAAKVTSAELRRLFRAELLTADAVARGDGDV
ncbi:MAG: PGL/p-HBAD biosynthesis glycosyltransferase [bacterium ADurb.Bin236]|nr:MAG: PGL/p-HBAD biosynthesis glycosyltransferase [bacterium ADurb.Bin236]HOY63915.1 glycosyltransferase family 2 protein [bacterium]HPN94034.1 glycosyltransferase family 2 protein [bacterium]